MLKTYRIFPLVFILFLFGFTLFTVAPVFAQTVDQLIESIEKLDANDRARVLEYKYSPPKRLSDVTPAAEADGPWDPSMGMRHPARPCMDRTKVPGGCGPDMRSPEQIASDPYDTNNPVSLAARRVADTMREKVTNAVSAVKSLPGPLLKCNKPPDVDRFGVPLKHQSQGGAPQEDCNTCSTMITKWSSYIKEHGRPYCLESQRQQGAGDGAFGMSTECVHEGPRDHTVPSVQVMQEAHDRCMMHARDGCGGDRSTIKSIKDNGPSQCPGYPGPCTTYRPHNKQMGTVTGMCPLAEFHLHCWKGGCTNGEGLDMRFDKCANGDASDVRASRNGCDKFKRSDGTRRITQIQ